MASGLLTAAAKIGDLSKVKQCIDAGARPDDDRNEVGNAPLHEAAAGNHVRIVQYLLQEAGANASLPNWFGKTAFELAQHNGHLQLAQFIAQEQRKQQQALFGALLDTPPSDSPLDSGLDQQLEITKPPISSSTSLSTDAEAKLKIAARVRKDGKESLSAQEMEIILRQAPDFPRIAAFASSPGIDGKEYIDCNNGDAFAHYFNTAPKRYVKRCYRFLDKFFKDVDEYIDAGRVAAGKVAEKVRRDGKESLTAEEIKVILKEAPDYYHIAPFTTSFDTTGEDIADCNDSNEFATYISEAPPQYTKYTKRCYRFLVDFLEKHSAGSSAEAEAPPYNPRAVPKGISLDNVSKDKFTSAMKIAGMNTPAAEEMWSKMHGSDGKAQTLRRPKHLIAFVVGNGNYKVHKALKTPVPDAEAIKRVLESHGVEVFFVHDCDSKEFWHQFDLFEAVIRPGDAVFFYFTGHGCTFNNSLRLLTICNEVKPDIRKDSINLNMVLARMTLCKTSLIVSFLDCCRDFKYEDTISDFRYDRLHLRITTADVTQPPTAGVTQPPTADATEPAYMDVGQHLTMFACAPNDYAYDGEGDHGAFTEILLKYLKKINLDLEELAKGVTKEMVAKYGIKQMPHIEGTLWEKWCLFSKIKYIHRALNIISLEKQVLLLKKKLHNSKDQYCRFLVSQGVKEDAAAELAIEAESKLKDNKFCKRIYNDSRELSAKQFELEKRRSESI